MSRAFPARFPIPFACSEGRISSLRSHIIMHIRYKQSCLIILRHISDRVISKHCKINEEKCDLQFPLIGKALAVPRHKVIALGLRRGEGQGQGPLSLQRPSTSRGSGELGWQEAGPELPVASWLQASPLGFEAQWDCRVTPRAACSARALEPGNRSPGCPPWAWECRPLGCPWDPCLAPSLL